MFCFSVSFINFFHAGLGRSAPDPSAAVTLNGVQVPLGKGIQTNIDDTSLLYNEYPLTPTAWCMNHLIIIFPNEPICFLLCYIIHHLIFYQKNASLTQYILFVLLSKPTDLTN